MAIEQPIDPTAMTFAEYANLDFDARCVLIDTVYEQNKEKIDQLLGHTAAWALICGPQATIAETAKSIQEVPTDDEVWDKAQALGYAPFQFFEDETIEDLVAVV
jgi:hypothetical protein